MDKFERPLYLEAKEKHSAYLIVKAFVACVILTNIRYMILSR